MSRSRKTVVLATLGAAALAAPSISSGSAAASKTYRISASLNAHQVVTPRSKPWSPPTSVSKARGTLTGQLVVTAGKAHLSWRISYANTGVNPLQIADIHFGKPGQFGPILVRLCGPCRPGQSGTKRLTASVARSIEAGPSWVTVITGTYPNGVIRGQIKVS